MYIWFQTSAKKIKGVPNIEENFLVEKYSPKKEIEGMDYEWMDYDFVKDGFPPRHPKERLPENLIYIVKKHKKLLFDYLNFNGDILIVSDEFKDFIEANGFKNLFEISRLKVINLKGEELVNPKKYFAIRIGKFDDNLFDFDIKSRIKTESLVGDSVDYLYPYLKLKPHSHNKNLFMLNEFCYKGLFIFNEDLKKTIEKEFYCPEIYDVEKFPSIYKEEFEW